MDVLDSGKTIASSMKFTVLSSVCANVLIIWAFPVRTTDDDDDDDDAFCSSSKM
jgi:hypothetical protein